MQSLKHLERSILVVDDDRKTVDLVRLYMENEGYQVYSAHDGKSALETARRIKPDLIVLDLMLPRIDGLEICRILRADSGVPIIMLTARTTEEDKLTGLELGADDYLTKPFSPRELVARTKAVLRRARSDEFTEPEIQQIGDILIDYGRRVVGVEGRRVYLTPREFRLMEILARYPGRAFHRMELLELAFGRDFDGLERTIDVHMMNLRKKIEPYPAQPVYIETVYGVGYRLRENRDVV